MPQVTISENKSPKAGNPQTPAKRPLPAGWWTVDSQHPGNKGLKTDATAAIAADANIPQHWKNAILEQLKKHPKSAVRIDASGQDENGDFTLAVHIKGLF